ncbi:DUF58 domain-containing protein [Solitalea longa]|uniref:DUF58 domain-containing protein n=1 Tax=Solitalea longa TaxID=2079460 RepID=A0A2S5AA70_9SPHI|nr:DUF58 domain-containing protein [Solitalea longa]POY39013.1 DUF58 domain-containing protein [Solitalea longa]
MRFIKDLYLSNRFFTLLVSCGVLFVVSFFLPLLYGSAKAIFAVFIVLTLIDYLSVFLLKEGFFARREMAEKLSNGSENEIYLYLENRYTFGTYVKVIDEIPHQFQKRDVLFKETLKSGESKTLRYWLRPVKRGEYEFGAINIFISTVIGLTRRRFRFDQGKTVPVYPSFIQMRKYELMAISNRLPELGIKRIRRIGHSSEFEQIKTYVAGDDTRTINWKATARKGSLMVNNYQDEKSQQVYCIIDKGRVMQMPFEGMSLLDYSINASLVLANSAMIKGDKAGIITFSNKISSILKADKKPVHLQHILELLYNQRTQFKESDYDKLFANIRVNINQRSLLVLFTNFESLAAMRRQLPFLLQLAKHHLVLTVFFENTEMDELLNSRPANTEEIYLKTIAEKFVYDKKLIVKELNQHGVHTLLTPPAKLTVNTLNRYLEFKARGLI